MQINIKPKEIRVRFVCIKCGKDVWAFAENSFGEQIRCPHCKKLYGWGTIVEQANEVGTVQR